MSPLEVKVLQTNVHSNVFTHAVSSQALLGHTDAVTCLTASSAYHIVVSGSRDRTCIIWDLNKLSFVTQLRGHRAPVSALCINELTVGWGIISFILLMQIKTYVHLIQNSKYEPRNRSRIIVICKTCSADARSNIICVSVCVCVFCVFCVGGHRVLCRHIHSRVEH